MGKAAESIHKGVQVIERNARSQLRIIEDILDVSRIVRGQLRLETQPVDLQLVVSEALESVSPAADAKRITTAFEAYDGPCLLVADPERLRQILWNLVSNAVKFTDPGGSICVSVRQESGSLVVEVRDTGWGIAPEFLPYVFDRFRQADGRVSRSAGGLGLGLAIVRHLVEMHGGRVTAQSAGLGLGSTFSVALPVKPFLSRVQVAAAPSAPDSEIAKPESKRSLSGMRLLLVEDEPDSCELIELFLSSAGAEVRAVGSAEEALEALAEYSPDVLVSDIGMAGFDGYWLIQQVRKSRPLLPALALTAFTRREDVARARSAGFNEHVAKPVDPEALVRTIASLRPTESLAPIASASRSS